MYIYYIYEYCYYMSALCIYIWNCIDEYKYIQFSNVYEKYIDLYM